MSCKTDYKTRVYYKDRNTFRQALGLLGKEMKGLSFVEVSRGDITVQSSVGKLTFRNRDGEMVATVTSGSSMENMTTRLTMLYTQAAIENALQAAQFTAVVTPMPMAIAMLARGY